jgi:hypothetical protein
VTAIVPPLRPLAVCSIALLGAALTACPGSLDDPGRFLIDGGAQPAADVTTGADVSHPLDVIERHDVSVEAALVVDAGCSKGAAAAVPSSIFIPTCTASGCHNPTDLAGNLDLESANVASRLVGVQAGNGPGVYVSTNGDPATSDLYLILTPAFPFDNQMPLGGPPFLDSADLACVQGWIMQQARGADGGSDAD